MREKVYYSISDVSEITGLEQYVLRFWEKEFSLLRPKKNRAGNRAYQKKDIELIEKIQFLLYEEMYTIEGARKKLKQLRSISLHDYKKTLLMLEDPLFIPELQKLLNFL